VHYTNGAPMDILNSSWPETINFATMTVYCSSFVALEEEEQEEEEGEQEWEIVMIDLLMQETEEFVDSNSLAWTL